MTYYNKYAKGMHIFISYKERKIDFIYIFIFDYLFIHLFFYTWNNVFLDQFESFVYQL